MVIMRDIGKFYLFCKIILSSKWEVKRKDFSVITILVPSCAIVGYYEDTLCLKHKR